MMPSSHLILGHPLLLLPTVPPSNRVFSNELTLLMRWPKYWSFSFSIIPSKEIPGGWISLKSKEVSRVFSNTTLQKHQFFGSHEVKSHLLLGRKVMTNLDRILKSRDITLPTKFRLIKALVLPVVMYGCGSWTIKKAEHRRIDAFELWCWRRLLRVPWTARRSNQSILKEISPEYSLEALMLKLKLQYFGHLM